VRAEFAARRNRRDHVDQRAARIRGDEMASAEILAALRQQNRQPAGAT
jgi:hypothetical protein